MRLAAGQEERSCTRRSPAVTPPLPPLMMRFTPTTAQTQTEGIILAAAAAHAVQMMTKLVSSPLVRLR